MVPGGSSLERLRLHHIVIEFLYNIIQITSSSHLLMSDFHFLFSVFSLITFFVKVCLIAGDCHLILSIHKH
jgi:hypothetical protein